MTRSFGRRNCWSTLLRSSTCPSHFMVPAQDLPQAVAACCLLPLAGLHARPADGCGKDARLLQAAGLRAAEAGGLSAPTSSPFFKSQKRFARLELLVKSATQIQAPRIPRAEALRHSRNLEGCLAPPCADRQVQGFRWTRRWAIDLSWPLIGNLPLHAPHPGVVTWLGRHVGKRMALRSLCDPRQQTSTERLDAAEASWHIWPILLPFLCAIAKP